MDIEGAADFRHFDCWESNGATIWISFDMSFTWSGDLVAEKSGDGTGHQEKHGPGEDEAVSDPLVVEQTRCLRIERTEESFDAAHRSVWVKDA